MQSFAVRVKQAETLEAKLKLAKAEPAFVRDIEALASRSGATVEQVSSPERREERGCQHRAFRDHLAGRLRQYPAFYRRADRA